MAPAPFPTAGKTSYAPVDNGASIIQQLFPKARITSSYRSPDNPLSRANPNSWHTKSHAATDIAPGAGEGLTYQQFLDRINGAGYGVIEARDEAAHPLPWTTGPNWHSVLGRRRF